MSATTDRTHLLKPFVVLFRDWHASPLDVPEAFACMAEDNDHADEQCQDAYPRCVVLWAVNTIFPEDAIQDYYNSVDEDV